MATVRWVPGPMHLADAFTKHSPAIATKLEQVLQIGLHRHDPLSFVTTSDMPGPISGDSRGDNVQLPGGCEMSD